jgi:hypothetical protein
MTIKACLAVVLVIAACGGPAVTHTPIGENRYAIDGEGDRSSSGGEILRLMHEHAARICPFGYDVVDSGAGTVQPGQALGRPPTGMLVVECKPAR